MAGTPLYDKIWGWVNSVVNPPGTVEADVVPIGISDSDFSALKKDSPYIVIGYTPAVLTPIGKGGVAYDPQEKSTPGYFESGNTYAHIRTLSQVSDGKLFVQVDGGTGVEVKGIDLTESRSMEMVAAEIQASINAALSEGSVEVRYVRQPVPVKYYFQFVSDTVGDASAVLLSSSSEAGTDLLEASLLNGGESVAGVTDEGTEQVFLTDYEGDVEIRQVYGQGEYLKKLISTKWHPSVIAYFDKQKFSLSGGGPIQGIPFRDGHKTIQESMMTCTFSFFDVSREDVYTISNIGIDGVVTREDGTDPNNFSIGG